MWWIQKEGPSVQVMHTSKAFNSRLHLYILMRTCYQDVPDKVNSNCGYLIHTQIQTFMDIHRRFASLLTSVNSLPCETESTFCSPVHMCSAYRLNKG